MLKMVLASNGTTYEDLRSLQYLLRLMYRFTSRLVWSILAAASPSTESTEKASHRVLSPRRPIFTCHIVIVNLCISRLMATPPSHRCPPNPRPHPSPTSPFLALASSPARLRDGADDDEPQAWHPTPRLSECSPSPAPADSRLRSTLGGCSTRGPTASKP